MTLLTKPVTRETASLERGVPLIATMHPHYLELRIKGTRRRYRVDYASCLWLAVKRQADEDRRDKLLRGKGREKK